MQLLYIFLSKKYTSMLFIVTTLQYFFILKSILQAFSNSIHCNNISFLNVYNQYYSASNSLKMCTVYPIHFMI